MSTRSTTTTAQLQELFQAIALTTEEQTLQQDITAQLSQYFHANRCKLFYQDDLTAGLEQVPPLLRKAISIEENPVLRYLTERHTAVHDEIVLPPGLWETICPRADHAHVMAGPIIHQGKLIGGLAFTRHRQDSPFNADNLADLSALCLHVSTQIATLRTQKTPDTHNKDLLTPREQEIAALVAKGLTNKKIGETLWITENSVKQALKRMYRKLKVSSRAEMVSQL